MKGISVDWCRFVVVCKLEELHAQQHWWVLSSRNALDKKHDLRTFYAISHKDPLVGLWKNTWWPALWAVGPFYECHVEVVKEAFRLLILSKSSGETPPHDEPGELSSKCFCERTFHCQHTAPSPFSDSPGSQYDSRNHGLRTTWFKA